MSQTNRCESKTLRTTCKAQHQRKQWTWSTNKLEPEPDVVDSTAETSFACRRNTHTPEPRYAHTSRPWSDGYGIILYGGIEYVCAYNFHAVISQTGNVALPREVEK